MDTRAQKNIASGEMAIPLLRIPSDPCAFMELGSIVIHPNAKQIAQGWQDMSLATQALVPGCALDPSQCLTEFDCDSMSGTAAGKWLAISFGKASCMVDGKTIRGSCRVFEFEGRAILSRSEPSYGTSWELLLGDQADFEGGRSYGRAGLLSWDKEAVDFWPRFCACMSLQLGMAPLEARAIREAASIGLACSRAASRSSKASL